ncbi:S8 family serine peptidase [Xanthomonas citri]|uniref:S8 family serine peptidase n=1 Tax=Xanthomonas citri TaxID=346 RepID=UPI0021D9DB5F|nr:S8 family serine peptidase [Xanthomonas citri]
MSNASLRPRHRALGILGASALTSLLLATPAFAGDVYLGGLATAQTHQKFIVTYKDGSSALSSPSVLTTSLRTAARALPAKAGKSLGLNSVRRLAVGPELVQADRALDRAEAETLMRQLAADPNVQSVEVDQMLYPTLTPNDSRLSEQWAFGTTNAGLNIRPAWDKATGANVVVAVIDTSIVSHPDLDANILPGYDFISDATAARDGNGRDNNPADEGDWNSTSGCATSNSSWHGTHVAGICMHAHRARRSALASARCQPGCQILGEGWSHAVSLNRRTAPRCIRLCVVMHVSCRCWRGQSARIEFQQYPSALHRQLQEQRRQQPGDRVVCAMGRHRACRAASAREGVGPVGHAPAQWRADVAGGRPQAGPRGFGKPDAAPCRRPGGQTRGSGHPDAAIAGSQRPGRAAAVGDGRDRRQPQHPSGLGPFHRQGHRGGGDRHRHHQSSRPGSQCAARLRLHR